MPSAAVKAGFPAIQMDRDASHNVFMSWSFALGLAEIQSMAAAVGATDNMDIPIRFMPGGSTSPTNYALGLSYIRCNEAFSVGCTAQIVNEAGTVLAGASPGVAINSTKNVVPLVPVNAASGTSYSEAYLRLTLASSNFAAQTTGNLGFVGMFLQLPIGV